jgi:hypothetical protein
MWRENSRANRVLSFGPRAFTTPTRNATSVPPPRPRPAGRPALSGAPNENMSVVKEPVTSCRTPAWWDTLEWCVYWGQYAPLRANRSAALPRPFCFELVSWTQERVVMPVRTINFGTSLLVMFRTPLLSPRCSYFYPSVHERALGPTRPAVPPSSLTMLLPPTPTVGVLCSGYPVE